MSSKSKTQQTQGTTDVRAPWSAVTPQLNQQMSEAQKLYNTGGPTYTPWSQVADLNPTQLSAMQGTRDFVNGPQAQGLLNNSINLENGLLNGQGGYNPQSQLGQQGSGKLASYLSDNSLQDSAAGINRFMYQDMNDPAMQANIQGAMDSVQGAMPGMTALQGIGNDVAGQEYGINQNNALTNMQYNGYDQQQRQRLDAIGLGNDYQNNQASTTAGLINQGQGNQLAQSQLGQQYFNQILNNPIALQQALGKIGDYQQQYNQRKLDDQTNRWNFNQQKPWDNLNTYANYVYPIASFGGTTTGSQLTKTPGNNKASGAVGGAMSGATMGAALGPWGAAGGAVVGGLLGGLS